MQGQTGKIIYYQSIHIDYNMRFPNWYGKLGLILTIFFMNIFRSTLSKNNNWTNAQALLANKNFQKLTCVCLWRKIEVWHVRDLQLDMLHFHPIELELPDLWKNRQREKESFFASFQRTRFALFFRAFYDPIIGSLKRSYFRKVGTLFRMPIS